MEGALVRKADADHEVLVDDAVIGHLPGNQMRLETIIGKDVWNNRILFLIVIGKIPSVVIRGRQEGRAGTIEYIVGSHIKLSIYIFDVLAAVRILASANVNILLADCVVRRQRGYGHVERAPRRERRGKHKALVGPFGIDEDIQHAGGSVDRGSHAGGQLIADAGLINGMIVISGSLCGERNHQQHKKQAEPNAKMLDHIGHPFRIYAYYKV